MTTNPTIWIINNIREILPRDSNFLLLYVIYSRFHKNLKKYINVVFGELFQNTVGFPISLYSLGYVFSRILYIRILSIITTKEVPNIIQNSVLIIVKVVSFIYYNPLLEEGLSLL